MGCTNGLLGKQHSFFRLLLLGLRTAAAKLQHVVHVCAFWCTGTYGTAGNLGGNQTGWIAKAQNLTWLILIGHPKIMLRMLTSYYCVHKPTPPA